PSESSSNSSRGIALTNLCSIRWRTSVRHLISFSWPVAQPALISPNSIAHVIEAAHQHGGAISISPALDAVKKLTRSVGKLLCPQAEKSMIRVQRPILGLLN